MPGANSPGANEDPNIEKPDPQDGVDTGKEDPNPNPETDTPKVNEEGWDEETKKYIKSLRDENAKHRKKARSLEGEKAGTEAKLLEAQKAMRKALGLADDDELPPEEQAKQLTGVVESQNLTIALLSRSLEHGLSGEQAEYFQFLMGKALNDLDEDGELTEEAEEAIVAKVKAMGGGSPQKKGNSSVDEDGGGAPPPKGGKGDVTLEQFVNMTTTEKSVLFQKNRALYDSLFKQAREKRLL